MTGPEESTRDRLLDAAETLFSDRGFECVGIREIADTAGVNLSGIKYHFGSKHGLYLETIRRAMDRQGSTEVWALLDAPAGTRERAGEMFRGFIEAFLRVLLRSEEAGSSVCLVMQSALDSGEATDVVVREFVEPHHARLCRFVGQLRPEATLAERSRAAQSVMALLLHQRLFRPFLDRLDWDGNALARATPPGEAEIKRLADEIAGFALRGMGCADLADRAGAEGTDQGVR
ncbi:MAG: TetR/AcrR family transcriptional regulator [Phycisphaerales bacterium JB041]